MNDKQFLQWIYDRLKYVHGEYYRVDYMGKLRSIIAATPEDQLTPNNISFDKEEMEKRLEGPMIEIPQGLSREEMRDFMYGNYQEIGKDLKRPVIEIPEGMSFDEYSEKITCQIELPEHDNVTVPFNPCKHYDCGWCYHVEGGNSEQGKCLEPLGCLVREVL